MQMRAQASNLNEELGQVEYIFSDKTGTLTQNVMLFKKFGAGMSHYGTDGDPPKSEHQEPNVAFYDKKYDQVAGGSESDPETKALIRVMVFLATCHTIVIDANKGSYNAASPDELALVNFAKQKGYEFVRRDDEDNCVIANKHTGQEEKYKLLNVCEFNSTRKRMSCVF